MDEWGLLVIPREGGAASLRSIRDPDEELWAASASLPGASEAHALEDGLIILRAEDGSVFRFDPRADEVVRMGSVGAAARWEQFGRSGVFLDIERQEVLHLSRSGSWRYAIPRPVEWASPLEPATMMLLVRGEVGSQLWLLREGEERPAAVLDVEVSTPGLITAWGKRIVLTAGGDEGDALQVVTASPLASANQIDLGDAIRALASSPSSHEIYAALDGPPRLVAVNRFTGRIRTLAEFPHPLTEVRAGPFGDLLLAHDGSEAYRLPVGGGSPQRLETSWRADLPIALPGGRVLIEREKELRLLAPGEGSVESPVRGPADAWWLPIRWRPPPSTVVAGEVRGEALGDSAAAAGPAARTEVAPDSEGRAAVSGSEVARSDEPPAGVGELDRMETAAAGEEERTEPAGPPAGFYTIVGSARTRDGIAELIGGLADAGYPTALQTIADDAGEPWHRGLVGPFHTRGEAEAAARQLERERSLQAWVTELDGRSEPADMLR